MIRIFFPAAAVDDKSLLFRHFFNLYVNNAKLKAPI